MARPSLAAGAETRATVGVGSEVGGDAFHFPVAVAHGIEPAAAVEFGCGRRGGGAAASFFGFRKRALRRLRDRRRRRAR